MTTTMTIVIDTESLCDALRAALREYQCPSIVALEQYLGDPKREGARIIIGTLAALAMDNTRLRTELQRALEREGAPPAIRDGGDE